MKVDIIQNTDIIIMTLKFGAFYKVIPFIRLRGTRFI